MVGKSASPHNLVEGSIKQSLIRMTLPMIIGMFMLFTFSLVDTLFISFLGTEALTAISFTFPVTFTIMSLAIGLGIGASAVVGKFLGGSQLERAKEAATVINYLSFTLAAITVAIIWALKDRIFLAMGASPDLLIPINEYMSVWLHPDGWCWRDECTAGPDPDLRSRPNRGVGYRRGSLGDSNCLVYWLCLPAVHTRSED